jgi:hypothetical protein
MHALFLGVLLSAPASAQSQAGGLVDSVARVMQGVRADGAIGKARLVLRQVDRAATTFERDALADSLTAYLLQHGESMREQETGLSIFLVLANAGATAGAGTPYRGAAARLTRIAEESHRYVGGALAALAQLDDRREGISRLRTFAGSAHPRAWVAIRVMIDLGGADGLMAIKELHQSGTARNTEARNLIEAIGREQGWTSPAAGGG